MVLKRSGCALVLLGACSPEPPEVDRQEQVRCITEKLTPGEHYDGPITIHRAFGGEQTFWQEGGDRLPPAAEDAIAAEGVAAVDVLLHGRDESYYATFSIGDGRCAVRQEERLPVLSHQIVCRLPLSVPGQLAFFDPKEPGELVAQTRARVSGDRIFIRGPLSGSGTLSVAFADNDDGVVEYPVSWSDGVCAPVVMSAPARVTVTIEPYSEEYRYSVQVCDEHKVHEGSTWTRAVSVPTDAPCNVQVSMYDFETITARALGESRQLSLSPGDDVEITLSAPAPPLGILLDARWEDADGGVMISPKSRAPEPLAAGDILVAADGRPLAGMDHREQESLLVGTVGQRVRLTYRRDGTEHEIEVPYRPPQKRNRAQPGERGR